MTTRRLSLAFQVHPRLFGGAEQFLLRLLNELRANGHRILVTSSPSGRVLAAFAAQGFETLGLPGRAFDADRLRLVRALVERRADLAQTNLYSPLLALSAEAAGVPHVWRVGGHPDVVLRDEAPAARNALLRLMGSLSDAIVCNSRYVAERFAGLGSSRPEVIHNGVPPQDAVTASSAGHGQGRTHIGLVAHYYPQKRHQDFVRAAALVRRRQPSARFRIYGSAFAQPAMMRHRDETQALAARLDLGSALSYRTTPNARPALSWSDVVVLPSVGESCSNAVLEAMSAGRVVLASRSGGNGELVRDGATGLLFTPGDFRDMSQKLLDLIAEPAVRRRLGRKARSVSLERHSMPGCAQAYEAVYRALAG